MDRKTRIHDGLAGGLVAVGALLGYFVHPAWLLLPGLLGAVMLQSALTGFCPVYFTLKKLRVE